MIELKHLTKKFDHEYIFQDVSFTFPNQGLIAIVGPSGIGKSTLVNMLAGFDHDYQGDILIDNVSIKNLNDEKICAYRRNDVGFVFQDYQLISGYTVLENVLIASESKETEAISILSQLGLGDKLHEKVENLSGGQKQRVAIARALINEPAMIFADEPTGALDRKNADEIMALLKELSQTKLVLLITHDSKCASLADMTITIENKQLHSSTSLKTEIKPNQTKSSSLNISTMKWAKKNFKIHFKKQLLIALAICIGSISFMLSFSSKNNMAQAILEFEENNTAMHQGFIKVNHNEDEILSVLQENKEIENVYVQYVLNDVTIEINQKEETLNEKYPISKATQQMSYGTMPKNNRNEIAFNPSLAARFDRNIQNLIGQQATIYFNQQTYTATISGIYNGVYDDFVVSSQIEKQMYENMNADIYSISYDVIDFEKIEEVTTYLEEKNISAQTASKEVSTFINTFENINRIFTIVSILIFVISIIMMFILTFKLQKTRYHEVGLLSCLGYTKKQIQSLLMKEVDQLIILSLIGNGILLVIIQSLPISFSFIQIILSFVLTILMTLIVSYISNQQMLKMSVSETLKK